MFDNILNRGKVHTTHYTHIVYRVFDGLKQGLIMKIKLKCYCVFDHFLGLFKFFERNESWLNFNLLSKGI